MFFIRIVIVCLGAVGIGMAPGHVCAQPSLDLTVKDTVELALENNRALKISQSQMDARKAGIGEVRSGFFPQMKGNAAYTRLDVAPYISLGEKSPFPMPPGTPSKITIGDDDLYDLGVSVEQPLFTGFALTKSYEMAKSSWEASKSDHETAENDLVYMTKAAYFSLLKARETVVIAKQSVELMESHVTDLKNMVEVGMLAENDLLKAQVQLSETKLMLISSNNAARLIKRRFCTILGIPLTTDIELKTPLEYIDRDYDLDTVAEQAIGNRPEIRSMSNMIKMADNNVSVARSQWYPQLMAVYNWSYKRPNREYEQEFYSQWTAGLVAQVNIFDWGGIHYRVSQAKLHKRQAEESVRQLADAVVLEVNQAYLTLEEARERIRVSEVNVHQAEENYRVTHKKFSQGLVTNTELLDANTALTRARIAKTNSLSDYMTALALLEKTIGGSAR